MNGGRIYDALARFTLIHFKTPYFHRTVLSASGLWENKMLKLPTDSILLVQRT